MSKLLRILKSFMKFIQKLEHAWKINQSLLQIGLDPNPNLFPYEFQGKSNSIFRFCREIVDLTAKYVCSFKPQIAYFSAYRAENQLEALCIYIREKYPNLPIVLDSKRGDISSTAKYYAYEAFERYQAHAVTVNPYMGFDSIEPYFSWEDRGVMVLCLTSNFSGKDLQHLRIKNGDPLYLYIADLVANHWNITEQCGLVIGATYSNELAIVREKIGNKIPLLIPGIGTQGGDIFSTVTAGINSFGSGIMINSSRSILYASNGKNWRDIVSKSALKLRDKINSIRYLKNTNV